MGVMERPLKPRILGDVVPRAGAGTGRSGMEEERWNAFGAAAARINLSYDKKTFRIPVTRSLKALILFVGAAFLVLGSVAAPTIFTRASGDATTTDTTAERNQLQDQLQQLEGQINQYEGQIASYQKQGSTLNGEISQLNAKIAKLNLQIQATNLTIAQLNQQIGETQSQIPVTQADIANKKTAIGGLIQELVPERPSESGGDLPEKSAPLRFLERYAEHRARAG